MTSRKYSKLSPHEEWILKFFLDQSYSISKNDFIEKVFPNIVMGYIPPDFRDRFRLDQYSEAFDSLVTKGYLVREPMDRRYKLSSLGEDYILEVLWKYE